MTSLRSCTHKDVVPDYPTHNLPDTATSVCVVTRATIYCDVTLRCPPELCPFDVNVPHGVTQANDGRSHSLDGKTHVVTETWLYVTSITVKNVTLSTSVTCHVRYYVTVAMELNVTYDVQAGITITTDNQSSEQLVDTFTYR